MEEALAPGVGHRHPLKDPGSLITIALILGSPGILLGAIAGALLWRRRRIAGALLGAVVGFVLWLVG
jgi:Na+/proline symporter